MNPAIQKIIEIINASLIKSARKKTLTHYLEKDGITKDFFELLEKNIADEAKERKGLFLEVQKEWKKIYATVMEELGGEEKESDELFSKQLTAINPQDTTAKLKAFQTYSIQQTAIYQTYQKKMTKFGTQYTKQILEKITSSYSS